MTNEERDIIARFIERFGGQTPPQAGQPPLPPIDAEADAYIREQMVKFPQAQYRIVQSAYVQEAALVQMQQRVQRLQWELDQARQAQPEPQTPARTSFLGGLFGGNGNAAQPQYQQPQYQQAQYNPPPPQYAPGMAQPGMVQGGGQGFLGSALTTAAGVAGGMVMGNVLMDMFSGHSMGGGFGGGMGGGFGGGFGGAPIEETTIVNNYNDGPQSDPWGGSGGGIDPSNQTWTDSDNGDSSASDWSDNSGGGSSDDWG